MADLTLIERRDIQAPFAARIIRKFAGEMGEERAFAIAAEAIGSDAEEAGRKAAETFGGNSLREFARVVREMWAADDALEVRFIEETDRRLRFDVVRCRYAELYDRLGMKDLAYAFSCNRDESFLRGFNPKMRMTRTATIVQGAPACDFCFTLEE
jgi:hypothetical protein